MPNFPPRRSDVRKIAAVDHPSRRQLLETITAHGPATASQLAQRTGQLVGNVSHHLKMLAGAGLIEEVPERARDRRERWWGAVPMTLAWTVTEGDDGQRPARHEQRVDPVAEHQMLTAQAAQLRQWVQRRRSYEPEWRQAAYSADFSLTLTSEELVELGERITDLVTRFQRSVDLDDGQDREPVFAFVHAVPSQG